MLLSSFACAVECNDIAIILQKSNSKVHSVFHIPSFKLSQRLLSRIRLMHREKCRESIL